MGAAAATAALCLVSGTPAAVAAPPEAPAPAVDANEPQPFDPGNPVVWTPPSEVDRSPVGGTPDGSWEPTSAQPETLAGSTSESSAALAAAGDPAGSFAGSGAAGATLGVQPFYGVENFALAPGVTATVNLATGNLVIRSQDMGFNAPGLSLHLDSFHNSRATGTGALGVGAVLSTGHDVGLKVETGKVTFYGPSGFTAAFTANGSGGWTAPAGINADLVHHGDGTWSLTYRKNSEKLTFTAGGYLIKDVDRNGVGLTLAYDGDDKLSSITDGAGRVTTFSYQAQGNLSEITDPTGRITDYNYDNNNLDPADNTNTINNVAYPDGSMLGFTAGADGRVTKLTTREDNQVAFSYDSTGRVTKVEQFLTEESGTGAAVTTSFEYLSSSTKQTNPLGGVSTYTLDAQGRVTKVVDPLNRSRSVTWTANSDISTAVDAMGTGGTGGNTISYTYDALNNRTAVTMPTGAATRAAYAQGSTCTTTDTGHPYQAKCTTDDAGRSKSMAYDGPGNVTAVTDTTPGGSGATTQSFAYQAAGSGGTQCGGKPGQICSATDGRGKTTSYAYDTVGNLTTVTPPAPLGATTYGYDTASRLTSVTDGLGQVTSYAYDALDRLTSTTYDSGAMVTNFYDDDGNLIKTTDTTKGTSTYVYDTLGRETARTQPGMTGDFDTDYDHAGNVLAVEDPEGDMAFAYDTAYQLTSATEPGNHVTTFGYDANGRETTRTLPNTVVQTTTRDNTGRPTRIRAVNGAAAVVSDLGYSYTKPGTSGAAGDRAFVQTRTDHLGVGGPAGSTTTYGYDSLSRLTAASEKTAAGAANASWAYAYDAAGNRTSQTLTGATGGSATPTTPAATTTWGYNNANELTSRNGSTTGWSYDANGNQLKSPDWGTARYGVRSSMRDITSPTAVKTTFEYLGGGNTTRLEAGGTAYTNGSLGLATATTGTNPTMIYRRTPDGALLSTDASNTPRRYFLTDMLGSVVAITSDTGAVVAAYSYDPYGNTRTATGTDAAANPIRYSGGYLDLATGLYKLGARYYDPTTGRFTQQDPSGQEANPYLYATGNPCNSVDPTGLDAEACLDAFFSNIIPGVAGLVAAFALAAVPEPTGLTKVGAYAAGFGAASALAAGFYKMTTQC